MHPIIKTLAIIFLSVGITYSILLVTRYIKFKKGRKNAFKDKF